MLSDNRRATADDGRTFGPVPTTGMLQGGLAADDTSSGRPKSRR